MLPILLVPGLATAQDQPQALVSIQVKTAGQAPIGKWPSLPAKIHQGLEEAGVGISPIPLLQKEQYHLILVLEVVGYEEDGETWGQVVMAWQLSFRDFHGGHQVLEEDWLAFKSKEAEEPWVVVSRFSRLFPAFTTALVFPHWEAYQKEMKQYWRRWLFRLDRRLLHKGYLA